MERKRKKNISIERIKKEKNDSKENKRGLSIKADICTCFFSAYFVAKKSAPSEK